MGCDIHMFVNYKRKDSDYWQGFGGDLGADRNYTMFGVLAGVRSDTENSCEPKGYPTERMSYQCEGAYHLIITEDGKGEGETTLKNALEWNKNYHCKLYYDNDGKPYKVRHPDWHTPSWMTTKELSQAYRKYVVNERKEYGSGSVPITYQAILDLMRSLEKKGYYECKLVFWFDN